MSQVITKKKKKPNPPPKLNTGQHGLLAARLGKPAATIRKHYTQHKYDKYIKNGEYNLDDIEKNIKIILKRKYQRNREKQHKKKSPSPAAPINNPTINNFSTDEEIKSYLDETIEYLSKLSEDEIDRRNELEKLLMAQIKRKQVEGDLIRVESAQKTIELILSTTINQLESLSVKTSPLLAVEQGVFECQQVLNKEIDFIRKQIIADLKKVQGSDYVS